MLTCPHIDTVDLNNPAPSFANALTFHLGMSWEAAPPPFSPGVVRMGWRGDRILYYAELTDAHLFTTARQRNERLWETGDTFEFFAGVAGDPRYVEYHCAPNGVVMQLLLPPRLFFSEQEMAAEGFLPCTVDDDSTARVLPFTGGWAVYGEFCAKVFGVTADSLLGQEWDINFSRYDCASLDEKPMTTSSVQFPPDVPLWFHRREYWPRVKCM